jgi:cytidyltransferase-like protein
MGNKKNKTVVAVSGAFDPLHVGHIRLFEAARALGDKLVVILNNDNWIKKKKGAAFMHENDRKYILEALGCVDKVFITKHESYTADWSVSDALREIKPDIFANGGDRTNNNVPEVPVCKELNIKMIHNVGQGGKLRSSSELLKQYSTILSSSDHKSDYYMTAYEDLNKKEKKT